MLLLAVLTLLAHEAYGRQVAVGKDAEGPDTMCLPDWEAKETFRSTQAARCGANYKLNHYTGKCVPNSRYWIDPQTCSETKCGGYYKCDPATILCLHMDKFGVYGHIVEKAPQLKKCAEIYDPYGGQMWWGETANEASLGQTFDSDEQQVGVDAQGPNTMCLATEDVKDKFTHAMDYRCNAHWHLNKYTGKCVPESNYQRDPQTCGEVHCGYWFKCDPATLLCLKKSGEKAPPLAKCKDVYEVTNPMDMYWFGETADEAEVGFNGDSDENAVADPPRVISFKSAPASYSAAPLHFFAVVGAAFLAYGAFKHYSGDDGKEFTTLV